MALKVLQDTRHIRVGLNPNFLRMQERPPILRREDRVNNQVGRDWGIEYDNNISIRSNQCDSDALSGRFPCACRSQGRSPGLFSVRPSGDWSRPEKMSKLHCAGGDARVLSLDICHRPKGENRTAHGLQPWERRPRENRPERAAECRASFPKITFVESDSMAFQKLTKLFLVRKFAVMLSLMRNVGGNTLYVRLAY